MIHVYPPSASEPTVREVVSTCVTHGSQNFQSRETSRACGKSLRADPSNERSLLVACSAVHKRLTRSFWRRGSQRGMSAGECASGRRHRRLREMVRGRFRACASSHGGYSAHRGRSCNASERLARTAELDASQAWLFFAYSPHRIQCSREIQLDARDDLSQRVINAPLRGTSRSRDNGFSHVALHDGCIANRRIEYVRHRTEESLQGARPSGFSLDVPPVLPAVLMVVGIFIAPEFFKKRRARA